MTATAPSHALECRPELQCNKPKILYTSQASRCTSGIKSFAVTHAMAPSHAVQILGYQYAQNPKRAHTSNRRVTGFRAFLVELSCGRAKPPSVGKKPSSW